MALDVGAATLVAVNAALNRWVMVSERAARVLEGKPTIIIKNGRFLPGAARRLALRPADVEQAIRVQNGHVLGVAGQVHRFRPAASGLRTGRRCRR